jgi:hypothetical protein
MPKLPVVSGAEVARAFERSGTSSVTKLGVTSSCDAKSPRIGA